MANYKFSERSQIRLDSCHKDLRKLAKTILLHRDITILEGYRGKDRQNELFTEGKSKLKYPNSRHNVFPARAIDMMPYPVEPWMWGSSPKARDFWMTWGGYVRGVADAMGIKVTWGGDWDNDWNSHDHTLFDGPHFQLEE